MIKFDENDENIINLAVNTRTNIFLHGPGGTGKSTLLKEICERSKNKKVVATATTGVAAINIKGCTLHRFAGINLGSEDEHALYKIVMKKRKVVKRWRNVDLLIIDEISMLGGELLEKLDYIARKIRMRKEPMGNIQIIFSGDLLQLPPIKDKWIFDSTTWVELKLETYNLTEPKRYKDNNYFETLLRIREGKQNNDDIAKLEKCHEEYKKMETDIESWDIKPTILHSRRMDVDYVNDNELDKLDGDKIEFKAIDTFEFKMSASEQQKVFYKTLLNDAIPENIYLKAGAQVMLKKNVSIESELANGSRGVIVDINKSSQKVNVKFLNGITTPICYENWEFEDDDVFFIRQQMPLVLAYSLTIHKSQGSTLDFVVCDLGPSVFAFSQAYVALSRVKDIKGLYLTEFDASSIRADPIALNYIKNLKKLNDNAKKCDKSSYNFVCDWPHSRIIKNSVINGFNIGNVKWRGTERTINIISLTQVEISKEKIKESNEKTEIYPLLKSNLQKQIRRFQAGSVSTAEYMWEISPFELLRRISIISCEDSELFAEISTIVWLMAASSKGLILTDEHKKWTMGIIEKLAKCNKCMWLQGGGFSRTKETTFDEIMNSDHSQKNVLAAIFFRTAYGGLKQDPVMLSMMIKEIMDKNVLLKSVIPKVTHISPHFIVPASLDYHVYPNIIKKLHEKYPEFSYNDLERTIWKCSSGINYRINRDPQTEFQTIWNKIEKDFKLFSKERFIEIKENNEKFSQWLKNEN